MIPHLPHANEHKDRVEMLNAFWAYYRGLVAKYKHVRVVVDCGSAIETRIFHECIALDLDERNRQGPYYLDELATLRYAAGLDPTATCPRKGKLETPAHHPVADAVQSYRLWREAESKVWWRRVLAWSSPLVCTVMGVAVGAWLF